MAVVLLLVVSVVAACSPAEGAEPAHGSPGATAAMSGVAGSSAEPPAPPSPRPSARVGGVAEPAAPVRTATPSPSRSSTPSPTPPKEPYAINLATAADFVPQYTFEWCVGASIQMARSIITDKRNESRASQQRLWDRARDLTVGSPYGGANPAGWAAALNDVGLGPYRLVSLPTLESAVEEAARALAETERPVGLVMWAGRHAWIMTGFESAADPRVHEDAGVTRVRVMDPLYPHGSRWGPSPRPNRLVRLDTLARQFVMRNRPDYDFGVDPGWLLVLPVD